MTSYWQETRAKAIVFQKRWEGAKSERSEAQIFLYEFLNIFGIDPVRSALYEKPVHMQSSQTSGFIDMLIPGKILVEMKSRGQSLERAHLQAREYAVNIDSDDDLPKYIMVCDFERIRLYQLIPDMQWEFLTKDLPAYVEKFAILTSNAVKFDLVVNKKWNVDAAYKMANLYKALADDDCERCVLTSFLARFLFCCFSDHSGVFNDNSFYKHLKESCTDGSDIAGRVWTLFDVLNTPTNKRQKSLQDRFGEFPYVNGGLLKENRKQPHFNEETRRLLLECCEFEWSEISPVVFGAMFQKIASTKNVENLGRQYTPKNAILNVISPLFLDDLQKKLRYIGKNERQLRSFHDELARLKFLDPACGCGNFLMVIYQELRELEIEVLKRLYPDTSVLETDFLYNQVKVNVSQFFGIEIDAFSALTAKVGLWLMDQKMNNRASTEFGKPFLRLPLSNEANIQNTNALQSDWLDLAGNNLSYIVGNPPFSGARKMTKDQKNDLKALLTDAKIGNFDYVAGWFMKAAQTMKGKRIKTAFISTNSIVQGIQPSILWKTLNEKYEMTIDFAYPSFKWQTAAQDTAKVHCVIIGFSSSSANPSSTKKLFKEGKGWQPVKEINAYLMDSKKIEILPRKKPLCDVPKMMSGNKPIDDGNYLFTADEMNDFIATEPNSKKYFRPWYGSEEFLEKKPRYCLFLRDATPQEITQMPEVQKRMENVKEHRKKSKSKGTRALSQFPRKFHVEVDPCENYLLIPEVSSEKRRYIPMGFMEKNNLCSNLAMLIPGATLYEFGVLTSSMHMVWVKAFCGRLEMRFRYSIQIVYNNFPWPIAPETEIKTDVINKAEALLNIRDADKCSFANLYNDTAMPNALMNAHLELDKVVKKAYGLNPDATEEESLKKLTELYEELSK